MSERGEGRSLSRLCRTEIPRLRAALQRGTDLLWNDLLCCVGWARSVNADVAAVHNHWEVRWERLEQVLSTIRRDRDDPDSWVVDYAIELLIVRIFEYAISWNRTEAADRVLLAASEILSEADRYLEARE